MSGFEIGLLLAIAILIISLITLREKLMRFNNGEREKVSKNEIFNWTVLPISISAVVISLMTLWGVLDVMDELEKGTEEIPLTVLREDGGTSPKIYYLNVGKRNCTEKKQDCAKYGDTFYAFADEHGERFKQANRKDVTIKYISKE